MANLSHGVVPASVLNRRRPKPWLAEWARFARGLAFSDLPTEVMDRAKLVLLDSVGAILAGHGEPEVKAARTRLARTAKARRAGSPLLDAFLGGTAGTMLEIDEGNQYARGHPGMHVVPALLATATLRKVSGAEALTALTLGYEIGARIGIASKLKVTMHPHGVWGTVGAAVGVAKLHRASAENIRAAINVASSFGLATSRRTMLEGATVRNAYAGVSNMLGLMAFDLVKAGFTGEKDGVATVFSGIAADGFEPAEMTRELGLRYEIARNYFKRHAACRYTHGALDALEELLARTGPLRPAEVKAIRVETYVWAAQLDEPAPDNMLAAKFSLPFALATRIASGSSGLDAFRAEARADGQAMALAARVTVDEDPALTAKLPALRPARVTLTLNDGRVLTALAQTNKGDTEDPYAPADVIAKFHEVAEPVVGRGRARDIAAAALSIESAADFSSFARLSEAP
jgi:2-methylcitrate dehydratase PrpD